MFHVAGLLSELFENQATSNPGDKDWVRYSILILMYFQLEFGGFKSRMSPVPKIAYFLYSFFLKIF